MPILDRRNNQLVEDKDTRVSVGLNFPISRAPGNQDGFFSTSKTTIESIKNNIRLLLQTQKGERMFQPNLGMGIRRFLFEQITEETLSVLQKRIENDLENKFPIIEVKSLIINPQPNFNIINIILTYNALNLENEVIEINIENSTGAY